MEGDLVFSLPALERDLAERLHDVDAGSDTCGVLPRTGENKVIVSQDALRL
jgi:hypothetical protein